MGIINVYTDLEKAEILGFGGAFTEAAAYNYHLADENERKRFLEKYFSKEKGLGYNFGRCEVKSQLATPVKRARSIAQKIVKSS